MRMSLTTRQLLERVVEVDSTAIMASIMAVVEEKIVGQNLSTMEIVDILNEVGKEFEFEFRPKDSKNLSLNSDEVAANLSGGGTLDSGWIVIYYDPAGGLTEIFDDESLAQQFYTATRNVIEHELVHKEQLVRSELHAQGDDPHNVVQYLSNPSEIMAMAKQAVNQFLDLKYTPDQILLLLRAPWKDINHAPGRGESDVFWNYTEWFDGKDPVFQKFVRYMTDYLTSEEHSL
jgi:hypothetical protein